MPKDSTGSSLTGLTAPVFLLVCASASVRIPVQGDGKVATYRLTRTKADEFHKRCPSLPKHKMAHYGNMLEDADFAVGPVNRHWLEIYGRFGDYDLDDLELEEEVEHFLGKTACFF